MTDTLSRQLARWVAGLRYDRADQLIQLTLAPASARVKASAISGFRGVSNRQFEGCNAWHAAWNEASEQTHALRACDLGARVQEHLS